MHVSKPLNYQGQRLLIVAHATQEEHHLRHQVSLLTHFMRLSKGMSTQADRKLHKAHLFQIIIGTRTQEVNESRGRIFRVQLHLKMNRMFVSAPRIRDLPTTESNSPGDLQNPTLGVNPSPPAHRGTRTGNKAGSVTVAPPVQSTIDYPHQQAIQTELPPERDNVEKNKRTGIECTLSTNSVIASLRPSSPSSSPAAPSTAAVFFRFSISSWSNSTRRRT